MFFFLDNFKKIVYSEIERNKDINNNKGKYFVWGEYLSIKFTKNFSNYFNLSIQGNFIRVQI